MPLITIRERPGTPDGPNAVVSFDHQAEFPITVTDPFSNKAEKDLERELEWYFEEHLCVPFVDQVRAREAAESITAYGEALFKQVLADPKAYAAYDRAKQAGLETLRFEVAGSPPFHALHWEALCDPDLPKALSLYAPVVRKNLAPQPIQAAPSPSPTVNLLIVTARLHIERDVGYRTSTRPLVEGLRQTAVPVDIDIVRPGTYRALVAQLEKIKAEKGTGHYHAVHFDVHGAVLMHEQLSKVGAEPDSHFFRSRYGRGKIEPYDGHKAFLFFEGEDGEEAADPAEAGELAQLLVAHRVPIVILNACQSGKQIGATETSLGSRLMQAGAQTVLAMGYSVTVSAAALMMRALYAQLLAGRPLEDAILRARVELCNDKRRQAYFQQIIDLEDWLLPLVYQNQPANLNLRDFTPDESKAWYESQAIAYQPPPTTYGFFGRDLDILKIEKRLLSDGGNILLIRGMGGTGKTTLLRHLANWWQTTGFIERVFYFGYDERAWTRDQITHAIAEELLGKARYHGEFHPLSPEAQLAKLAQELRARRHLLILDNLESITGSPLALPNTLPEDERNRLKGLLSALADGQTLVLLGSRDGEEWLAEGTFGDNVYQLPGLDPQAASDLAKRILENEPRRDCRRLQLLRGWSADEADEVGTGGAGAGRADGGRAPGRARLGVGGDRLHGGDAAGLGPPGGA